VFLAGAAAPLAVALILLSAAMPLGEAARDALGHWLGASRGDPTALAFYRGGAGVGNTAAPPHPPMRSTPFYLALLGSAARLALPRRRRSARHPAVALGVFAVIAAVLGLWWRDIPWQYAAHPLPLFMLALIAALGVSLAHRLRRGEPDHALVMRFSMALFAVA